MHSKEIIELEIRGAIKELTGITCLDKNTSLIDRSLQINPVTFLYIFNMLEIKLQLTVHDIFMNNTFEVMTVNNLTNALFELGNKNI